MEAGSTTSSTSNTLTFGTPIVPTTPHMFPPSSADGSSVALLEALRAQGCGRHVFLQPPAFLPAASLQLVKDTLEGFAGSVSDLQLEQLRAGNKKKRKRAAGSGGGGGDDDDKIEVLKIRKVHVDGFETGQVWQQARRIIGSALEFSERAVQELEGKKDILTKEDTSVNGDAGRQRLEDDVENDLEDGLEDDFEDFDEGEDEEEEQDVLDDGDSKATGSSESDEPAEEYVQDPNGLNDGFFSIDEFNRVSQWFEDQDARGDPNTDRHSDDEDIDWDADISTLGNKRKPALSSKESKNAKEDDEDDQEDDQEQDDDDDEAGPTFGDMDLDAPEGASDDEDDADAAAEEEEPDFNANGIYYKDFFDPPARKPSKDSKRQKKAPSSAATPHVPDNAEIERAMADVHHNLYDDLSEQQQEEDDDDSEDAAALSDVSAGDPRSRQSNHQRRQAKIAEQIRKLEAELVAKRAWTLAGEAMAADRPVDSLLEEELDFEHVGKPVPVITTQVTEDIEAMIKRRIVAHDFDEVVRRRPDASSSLPNGGGGAQRRGLVSIEDAQSAKGLADIYEEEHVKAANPDSYVSASDEKMRHEEKEVERMWRQVCGKLDALSSWHYRPKHVEPAISVVADVAAVSMEDAQPATAQGIVAAAESILAPQEIYRAGAAAAAAAETGEVHLAKSGLPVARAEMTREDKLRRRRREKERRSKAGVGFAGGAAQADNNKKKKEDEQGAKESKGETLAQLRKGGVVVINKKGELVGVDGKKSKAPKGPTASGFKL